MKKVIYTPLSEEQIKNLNVGDIVYINGKVYGARDVVHKILWEKLKEGREIPIDLAGSVIYYVGPTPAPPGKIIGSAGPTTSSRMDKYTPLLLEHGLKGMIGKGRRSEEVIQAIKKYKAVYFITVGGAGAFLSKHITSAKIIAFPELGPEALLELTLENFPAIVAIDMYGNHLFSK